MAKAARRGSKPATKHRGPHQTLIQRSRQVPPAEKAAYHQVAGAGRSHVKRPFFGLSPADEDAIVDRIRQGLEQALKEA